MPTPRPLLSIPAFLTCWDAGRAGEVGRGGDVGSQPAAAAPPRLRRGHPLTPLLLSCRNRPCMPQPRLLQPCCTHQCSDHDSLLAGSRAGRRPHRQAPMPQCAAKGASALPRNPQPSPPASLPVTTQSGLSPGQWHPNAQGAGFRPTCCPECVLRLACMHTRSQQKLVHMTPLQAKPHPVQPRTSHHL